VAASAGLAHWPLEAIPDDALLYMRIHRDHVDASDGIPIPGAFRNRCDGMSTDWNKYSTPRETRARGRVPSDNGVVRLVVAEVRGVPGQTVKHTPDVASRNRAHTDVFGEKDPEVRMKLRRLSAWEIPI
jgi:hypothetical protein